MHMKFFVLLVLSLILAAFSVNAQGEGGIQYVVEVSVYRNLTNCDEDGSFARNEFVWIHMKKPMRFEEIGIFPSLKYELNFDPYTKDLIHKMDCPGLALPTQTCTVHDDYQTCYFDSRGSLPSGDFPNCYAVNRVITRRLKFRFCPAGFYFKGLMERMCEHCPEGTYSDAMNTDVKCKPCDIPTDGTRCKPYCKAGQFTSDNKTCTDCPRGYFNDQPDSYCKRCQSYNPQWYQDLEGQTACKVCKEKTTDGIHCLSCGPGQYWTNSQCNACPAGTYNDEQVHQLQQCKPCTGNQYTDQTGQTSCKTCGHLATQGNTRCISCGAGTQWSVDDRCAPCPRGSFNPGPTSESAKCSQCPSKTYTDVEGSTSCKACGHDTDGTACQKCGPGLYWKDNSCQQCLPGSYKRDETDAPNCDLCPPNSYAPRPGATQCDACSWPTDKTRTVCARPCPESGTSSRGIYGQLNTCICPPNSERKPVYKVQYYQDESNMCSAALDQLLIDNDGGAIDYSNAKLDVVGYKNGTVYTFELSKHELPKGAAAIDALSNVEKSKKLSASVQQALYKKILEDHVISSELSEEDDYSTRHLVIANRVNSDPNSTWKAKPNPLFLHKKMKHIRERYFGHKKQANNDYSNLLFAHAHNETIYEHTDEEMLSKLNGPLEDTYNFKTKYPNCNFYIWDQGACGSCVSVAAVSVLSDNFCVQTNGRINVVLSPQYLVSCASKTCTGWTETAAFQYLNARGSPTKECYPYTSGYREEVGDCKTTCADGSSMRMYYKKQGTHTYSGIAAVKAGLVQQGSLVASFNVYEDLLAYSEGVYTHKFGKLIEAHSIRVFGYGIENGVEYWRVSNSWGTDFGENGTFKVAIQGANINFGKFYGLDANLDA